MSTFSNWEDAKTFRRKPSRFKAVQYTKDSQLPPNTFLLGNTLFLEKESGITCHVHDSNWIVKDLQKNTINVITDDVFNLIFEE
jgi:hypothetical protein